MKKILCIGEALIDMICTDKGKPLTEGEYYTRKAGGAPTNVAAAIGALGGAVELAAKVGDDPFGRHLISTLEEFNVGTQWVSRDPNYFTTFAFVSLMENGERDFYFNRGADAQFSESEINNIPVEDFSIVHFGSATGFLPGPLQLSYSKMKERALQQQLFVSFDPNYRHLLFKDDKPHFIKKSWEHISDSHFFKVSDEEALLITETDSIEQAAKCFFEKSNAVFAITVGSRGTMFGMDKTINVVPSIPVQPVDTTGAGDAFVGAILFQLQKKFEESGSLSIKNFSKDTWHDMIHNANKAGARTCEYLGAMEAFKHLSSDIFN